MFTERELLQLLMAGTGSMGFALIFRIEKKNLLPAALGGSLAWLCYLIAMHVSDEYMIASFVGAVFCGFWSELWARVNKEPTTVFLISSVIPLIPGNALYQTMNSLVNGDSSGARSWGLMTLLTMIFVSLGTSLTAAVFIIRKKIREEHRAA